MAELKIQVAVQTKIIPCDILEIIIHPPSVTIRWTDDTRTKVTCMKGDKFDEDVGFMACVTKKAFGTHEAYKRHIKNARRVNKKR